VFISWNKIEGEIINEWLLARKQILPTERHPFIGEILVPTFVDRGVSRGQRGGSHTAVNLSFLDRKRLIFLQ
jgi:hypothetical protein